jgi:hypothetical protein
MPLGKATLDGATKAALYTVPASSKASVNLTATNTATETAKLCFYLHPSADVAVDADAIEFNVELEPGAVLERTGLVISADTTVSALSDVAGVNASVFGVEAIA